MSLVKLNLGITSHFSAAARVPFVFHLFATVPLHAVKYNRQRLDRLNLAS